MGSDRSQEDFFLKCGGDVDATVLTISHFNSDTFNSDFPYIDWNYILKTRANNIDELFSTFYKTLITL